MENRTVTIDASLGAQLKAANGSKVELRDAEGNVVGFFLSPVGMEKYEDYRARVNRWLDELWPPEEIERIKERERTNPRPTIPHEVVMKWVEGL